ncbi:MAG TPA: hypothetical protein VM491_23660, partial [Burkholderiaceae bacterium]|nr:hypothetical protein [Burkholderiaceae bacterium]
CSAASRAAEHAAVDRRQVFERVAFAGDGLAADEVTERLAAEAFEMALGLGDLRRQRIAGGGRRLFDR